MNPSLANCTEDELCRFKYDHTSAGAAEHFTLSTDSCSVWISVGGQNMEIPRSVFNRLIHGYQKPRKFVRKRL